MDKLSGDRLRWKFLAIMALATALPLVLYAYYPLKFFLNSLREIEDQSLIDEIGEIELLVRNERVHLEKEALKMAALSDRLAAAESLDDIPWGGSPERPRLREEGDIDLLAWISPEGTVVGLQPETDPGWIQEVESLMVESASQPICGTLVSGWAGIGQETYLLSVTPGESSGCLLLGVNAKTYLSPYLSSLNGRPIEIGMLEKTAPLNDSVSLRVTRPEPNLLVARKTLPGLLKGSRFYLEISQPRGLIGQIESNQTWYFLLFLGGLCIAGAIGTSWAASIVLKPLHRLTTIMGSISGPGSYFIRVPVDRSDEIGFLSESFNLLMARLERAQRDLEAAQRQALDSERLEAIHAMVVTLAHEINNPLTYILGQADLMLMEGNLSDLDKNSLEVIREMSLRIADVLKNLQELQKAEMTTYIDWQKMIKVEVKKSPERERMSPPRAENPSNPVPSPQPQESVATLAD